jgi:hypothetical protein
MSVRPRPCARCGVTIPQGRLVALPETRLCVQCSAAVGDEFDVTITGQNLGKKESIKKGGDDITGMTLHRRPVERIDDEG